MGDVTEPSNIFTCHDRATIFAEEFLIWWHEAGRGFDDHQGIHRDDGLKELANHAVRVLGGWQIARRLLRATE